MYCSLKLNLRRKGKRRLPSRHPQPLAVPAAINQAWSADFMSDALLCGRRFRTFNVVDDFNREALSIDIDLNLPAQRVIRTLDRIAAWRGYPEKLRLDNGPEFISLALADWAETHGVLLDFIQPGKPTQNSFIERFNRTYRRYQDPGLLCLPEAERGTADHGSLAGRVQRRTSPRITGRHDAC